MKDLYPLHGIVTVLNTPFDQNDAIDLKALQLNVSNALAAGVAGLLVPAMASEVQKLSHEEKISLVEAVLQTVDGAVPVFVGTAAGSPEESKRLIQSYQERGCKHYLIQLPYENNEQFKQSFLNLANLGMEVIMLQDWDANGYGLPDELIIRLFHAVPSFRCLKVETVPAGIKYSNILKLSEGKLNVSGGWAVTQLLEALERGVHAFMPTGMHGIYTRIYNEFIHGNKQAAKELFYRILPILAFSNQHLDISIHFFKRLLWKQGVYPTPNVRTPILPFDDFHRKTADELIERVLDIEQRIINE